MLAPFHPRAPRGWLWAAGAAVALHVLGSVALGGAGWAGWGEPSRSVARHGASSSTVTSLQVRLASAAALPSDAEALPVQATVDDAKLLAGQVSSLIEQSPPAAGGVTTFSSIYLPSDEVDEGPVPEPGWVLDEGVLERVGRASMRLRLWVSADGHIDRVAVLHAEPSGPWANEAIAPMPNTRMRPAERDGRAVASTIVVELSADLEAVR